MLTDSSFQANEMQLAGPVPPQLRHRYVEFRPIIKRMFTARGLRGAMLHSLLHRQHARIYNFDAGTEYGLFEARSEAASLQFLRMAHFAGGGRMFTYVLTMDGVLRFTETGGEFGIDMLSKHTMHSDVAMYVAFAGEFFVRRVGGGHLGGQLEVGEGEVEERSSSSHAPPPDDTTTRPSSLLVPIASPGAASTPSCLSLSHPHHRAANPADYQLVIDNDSGTYRPDKSELPLLQAFLAANLPGIDVVAMDWPDETLKGMKQAQREAKRRARARGSVMGSVMGNLGGRASVGERGSASIGERRGKGDARM